MGDEEGTSQTPLSNMLFFALSQIASVKFLAFLGSLRSNLFVAGLTGI